VKAAPEPIKIAIGQISGVPSAIVESSLEFVEEESAWAFRLRLTSSRPSDFVPKQTRWVVLVDGSYPAGRIRIYPAQEGGLVHTFPHQDRNVVPSVNHATWRTGKPCLDSPSQRLGRIAGGPEPKDDMEQRLRWHVERCLAWLHVAGDKQLMVNDEPFEVPQCPQELLNTQSTVVHDEGCDTWSTWKQRVGQYGEVHWAVMPGFENTIVAEKFLDSRGEEIRVCRRRYRSSDMPQVGYWWLWPSAIVLPPWHAPGTWAELRVTGRMLGIDVDRFLTWVVQRLRRKESAMVMIGYPIPKLWGGAVEEVHWQTLQMPRLPKKGFRPNAVAKNEVVRRQLFGGKKKLSYLKTLNWHPNRLQARGSFSLNLRSKSVALIGAGALGAAVAEILVRGGVSDMLIVDHDDLEAGNLVRHTLTGADLGCNKATAISARLQRASPMSRISTHAASLPRGAALRKLLEPFDIVLECTGEDDVLRLLGEAWWSIPRSFLSASLGFAANRLFLFGTHACAFPSEEFEDAVRPWLAAERSQWTTKGETLEGAGCWSPLFPARYDDVWLAAVAIVRYLESALRDESLDGLRVLEQRWNDRAAGFQAVEPEALSSTVSPTEQYGAQ